MRCCKVPRPLGGRTKASAGIDILASLARSHWTYRRAAPPPLSSSLAHASNIRSTGGNKPAPPPPSHRSAPSPIVFSPVFDVAPSGAQRKHDAFAAPARRLGNPPDRRRGRQVQHRDDVIARRTPAVRRGQPATRKDLHLLGADRFNHKAVQRVIGLRRNRDQPGHGQAPLAPRKPAFTPMSDPFRLLLCPAIAKAPRGDSSRFDRSAADSRPGMSAPTAANRGPRGVLALSDAPNVQEPADVRPCHRPTDDRPQIRPAEGHGLGAGRQVDQPPRADLRRDGGGRDEDHRPSGRAGRAGYRQGDAGLRRHRHPTRPRRVVGATASASAAFRNPPM